MPLNSTAPGAMPPQAKSVAVSPAQPDQDTYGPPELALFKTYTRESFQVAFGAQAPPYDPSRLIKTWFDSSVDTSHPDNIALYRVITPDDKGQWGYRQLVMPAQEAASVNLPGAVTYPPYVIAPTTATRAGAPLWPDRLSLESDARALLNELGITAVLSDVGAQWDSTPFPTLYGSEPRREWVFTYRSNVYNVGGLLQAKSANGIGAPGQWRVGETIDWLPTPAAPTGLDDQRPARPTPVRELLSNESLGQSLMGPFILRTDRRQAQLQSSGQVAAPSTAGFTADDRAMLVSIHDLLAQLAAK